MQQQQRTTIKLENANIFSNESRVELVT